MNRSTPNGLSGSPRIEKKSTKTIINNKNTEKRSNVAATTDKSTKPQSTGLVATNSNAHNDANFCKNEYIENCVTPIPKETITTKAQTSTVTKKVTVANGEGTYDEKNTSSSIVSTNAVKAAEENNEITDSVDTVTARQTPVSTTTVEESRNVKCDSNNNAPSEETVDSVDKPVAELHINEGMKSYQSKAIKNIDEIRFISEPVKWSNYESDHIQISVDVGNGTAIVSGAVAIAGGVVALGGLIAGSTVATAIGVTAAFVGGTYYLLEGK